MFQIPALCVAVVGDTYHLKERLAALAAPEDEVLWEICEDTDAALADIVLFDGSSYREENPDFPMCSRSLERILYAPPEKIEPLLDSGYFTGAWVLDCPDVLLRLWLRQVLINVSEKKKLEIIQTYLTTMIDSIPDLVWFKDLKGAHLVVNKAFGRAVGKTKEQCEGRGHYYIWDLEPDEYANGEYVCLETEEEVIKRRETCLFDEKVLSKSGLRQFKTYKSPLFDRWGEMLGTVGVAKDVTDLQNTSRELSLVLSSIPLATLVADSTGTIIFFNDRFCEYFSLTREQIQCKTYSQLCQQLFHLMPEELNRQEMTEVCVTHGDTKRNFQVQQQTLNDIFGNHFGNFFLGMDVTNEHQLREKILDSARTDFLTGLSNRRHFYHTVLETKAGTPVTLISFDLDNFKQVNDLFGHQAGDQVLILTTQELKKAFTPHLITRMGGDEFIVTLFGPVNQDMLIQQVVEFDQSLRQVLRKELDIGFLSSSAGIAQGTIEDPGLDSLLICVDKALYDAKARGKGQCVIYE